VDRRMSGALSLASPPDLTRLAAPHDPSVSTVVRRILQHQPREASAMSDERDWVRSEARARRPTHLYARTHGRAPA
jgi:hypothetical protein